MLVLICFFVISISILGFSIYKIKNVHQIDVATDSYNKRLKEEFDNLSEQIKQQINEYDQLRLKIIDAKKTLDSQEELSQKAFENYCEILEKKYIEQEKEYDTCKETLEAAYSNLQLKLMQQTEEVKKDLDKIKETREAAVEAIRREKEIEQKISFYCLQVNKEDLKDISVLESIKPKLNNSRILSMLIWQTYFRKPMTTLCDNVIGIENKSGVYKITNIKTKECYIGQAVDLANRWKDHAKAGLGIDTPAANKLYKAMQEYGIWNFSWEIIELCEREKLNEKEKYYIDLYQSKEYGYNSIKGNSK